MSAERAKFDLKVGSIGDWPLVAIRNDDGLDFFFVVFEASLYVGFVGFRVVP